MLLATHAIVGAAVGRFFPKYPFLAFIFAFISHFLIDAIPHWDYPLKSFTRDKNNPKDLMKADMPWSKNFIRDLVIIAIDLISGLILALYIFETTEFNSAILWGALGAVLPDALQFVYFKLRVEPFRTIHRFHMWVQRQGENHILENHNLAGLLSQASFSAVAVIIVKLIIR